MAMPRDLESGPESQTMARIIPFPESGRVHAMPLSSPAPVAAFSDDDADVGVRWGRWMACAQAGDRTAYHQLLKDIVPYLRGLSRRFVGNQSDAEDAVQEILIVVHEIRHTYEPHRPFKPWLKTIATRRCIDLLRKRTRRLQLELAQELDELHVATTDATPDQALDRRQQGLALGEAVSQLPVRQREAIRLLRISELSLCEAAAQSDQSIGSLKVACHRALKSLKRALDGKDLSHE